MSEEYVPYSTRRTVKSQDGFIGNVVAEFVSNDGTSFVVVEGKELHIFKADQVKDLIYYEYERFK